jgi:DNA recombination protein RmuC
MNMFVTGIIILAAVIAAVWISIRVFSRKIESDILRRIQDSFGQASIDALSRNSEEFLRLAGERLSKETNNNSATLEEKKKLIDGTLEQMKMEMTKVETMVRDFERDRDIKFGDLSKGLKMQAEQTSRLNEVTTNLNRALSDPRQRGLWGERMALDILHLIGLEEGINFIQQKALTGSRNRPDFTFLLPHEKVVNMDVKFPLDNFKKYLEEIGEATKAAYKTQFLRDARTMIKQVTSRDYINTDADTLDYVIVFIPLEQAYTFIMENDSSFIDDALRLKVIVCSPWTLYAALSVIRQTIDNFNLERSAHQILELMKEFYKQWENYVKAMEKLGKGIDDLQKDYLALVSTRRGQLEKSLQQIEQLTKQKEHSLLDNLTTDNNGASISSPDKNHGNGS